MKYKNNLILKTFGLLLFLTIAFGMGLSAKALEISLSGVPTLPPESIGNLSIPFFTTDTTTLRWEVSDTDQGAIYDIRYSTENISSANFETATTIENSNLELSKIKQNVRERMYTVSKLTPGKTYHFALKSKYPGTEWSSISDVPSITLPLKAPTNSTFPNTNLKFGDQGESISDLQNFLTKQGLYSGPITKYFGKMTKKAVVEFQKKNKISPAEGYVGQLTRGAIQKLLKAD